MSRRADSSDTPRTAAEWFALRRAPHDAAFDAEFAAWLAERPENREEYALCEITWELSADAVRGMEVEAPPSAVRRRLGVAAAAAALVALPVLGFVLLRQEAPAPAIWRTAPGEQRSITLADGSHVLLNTRSELEVRIERDRRSLRLRAGEAFFEVAKDPSRPFVVETALGTARAVGTRFNVLVADERVEVETEEGRVLVRATDAPDAAAVLAAAGTRATVVRGSTRPTVTPTDLARVQNWRAQRLEFDGAPLREVLAEFSRYTELPVRAANASVGDVRVSAVLRPGDLAALRTTLRGALGLSLVERPGEWIVTDGTRTPD